MLNFLLLNTTSIAEVNDDFTILWILLSGILVFFMQAGFTLVESGFTRSKNAVNISMKNILDISVGTISFWFLGYGLMYGDTNGWIATSNLLFNPGDGAHDVFFQTVFCATAALKRIRNLNADEIYDQVVAMDNQSKLFFNRPLTNIVFMGMGEPLMNYKNVLSAINKIIDPEGLAMSPR